MPSDETRRLLKLLGIAVTNFDDACHNQSSPDVLRRLEAEARARMADVNALLDRLRSVAEP